MTTIAINKTQIAGDLQLTHSNGIVFKSSSKLLEYTNPAIYDKTIYLGFAGNVEIAGEVLEYFVDPVNFKLPKKYKEVEFVCLTKDKKMFTFSDPKRWYPILTKHYALGSGSHFAMGAMEAGKTPKEAVQLASKLDKSSGFGVTYYNV